MGVVSSKVTTTVNLSFIPKYVISNSNPDLDVRDQTKSSGANTELSTDMTVSLFSTVLSNALEHLKNNIIQHFESCFVTDKSEKAN